MLEHVSKDKNVDKVNALILYYMLHFHEYYFQMDESLGSKSVKSSTAFFTQLQDEVKQQIRSKSSNKSNNNRKVMNAKRIKL